MVMASASERALPVVALVLRVFTLLLLGAALVIIATDKIYVPFIDYDLVDPPNFTFRDLPAFRYILSVAVIGCAYTVLVIPFAAIHVAKGKRVGRTGATAFLIFSDVVFAVLIATGAAAGLGVSAEIQQSIKNDRSDYGSDVFNFYILVDTSCGLMLAAVVCMVATITISVHSLT